MQPAMPPPRPRPTGWIVATSVLAAVALALAVTVALLASGDDEIGASGESSAQVACDLISQVPEDGFDMAASDKDEFPPHLARLSAAETLATLATSLGDEYDDLYDAIRKPRNVANAQFDATADEFVDALADARDACSDEGL